MQFVDRADAGRQLADRLKDYAGQAVVYALPRGGVLVAAEVARELEVPLDLIMVRKIGHPYDQEYAIGAVAEGNQPVMNAAEVSEVDEMWLDTTVHQGQLENERRRREYFPTDYQPPAVAGKTAIIVDDGIATGLTMRAAIIAARLLGPASVVVAVPVAPADVVDELSELADEIIVIDNPAAFMGAVGAHYQHFPQVTDAEVVEALAGAYDRHS